MKRNIAFVVSSNNVKDSHFIKAKKHLSDLAKQYQDSLYYGCIGSSQVLVVYEYEMTCTAGANCLTFPIGNSCKEMYSLHGFDPTLKRVICLLFSGHIKMD